MPITKTPASDALRSYNKGYAAGMRRAKNQRSADAQLRQQTAFWQRAFLAALPACITVDGWTRGDKPITSVADRAQLARDFADEALRLASSRSAR